MRIRRTWTAGVPIAVLCAARPLAGLRAVGAIGYVLAFAALVIVPLGVSLAATPRRDGSTHRLYRLAARTHPFAALAGHAELGQGIDRPLLKGGNIAADIGAATVKIKQDIGHALAWAMIGNLASTIGLHYRNVRWI